MKVILLQDVKGTGKKGQVVEVSEGHGNNFLIPRKLAMEPTKANLNALGEQQKQAAHKQQKELDAAKELAERLQAESIKIPVRVSENGKIFGSISNKEIAEAFLSQTGIAIDRKKIVLPDPIKAKGSYSVNLKLHPQVAAKLNFEVIEG